MLNFSFSIYLRISEEQGNESTEMICLAAMFKILCNAFLWGNFGGFLPLVKPTSCKFSYPAIQV